MVKKPKAVTLDVLGTSGTVDPLAQTFTLSDTGTFSKDMFSVGKDGVTNSPLSHGEISALRLDDLDLGRLLGKGASSRVYLATHRPTQRPLALKVLQDLEREQAARHSLVSEMKVVFNALSDHLVGFYDAFLHEGAVYLALEYMDAGSLLDVYENAAREGVRVPEPLLAHILFQILQGLTYLHRERHAVHRDLKPANILLNAAGFVKLSDFGAPRAIVAARNSFGAQFGLRNSADARLLSAGISKQLDSTRELAESYCGTRAYMSPERTKGEPYGLASDVWSFGLLALEGACGRYPYPAATYFDLVSHIVDGPPPTDDAAVRQLLSPELHDLVHASLAKEPTARPDVLALLRHPLIQRHQSNAELQRYLTAALQAGMAGGSPDVTRASPEQTPTRPR